MSAILDGFDALATKAVADFWLHRQSAKEANAQSGMTDLGERGSVTAGKNMDGFLALVENIVRSNGLTDAEIIAGGKLPTLPGYFRPTKTWDVLVMQDGVLIAAIELKSQVGPSFGNNFNNRAEEAIGSAHDFAVALREGAFGNHPRPWVGWLILVEECADSRSAKKRGYSAQFPVFSEFVGLSYLQRYDQLARKMMLEQLYSAAAVISSRRDYEQPGQYSDVSNMTSLRMFASSLAGHVAGASLQAGCTGAEKC